MSSAVRDSVTPAFEQPALELAQLALAAAVGVRDQRPHHDAALDRRGQRLFDRLDVETKNDNVGRTSSRARSPSRIGATPSSGCVISCMPELVASGVPGQP